MKLSNILYSGNLNFKAPERVRTNILIFTGDGSDLITLNARGKEFSKNTTHTNTITSISEDLARNVYSGSSDSTVKKFDTDGGQLWNYSEITGQVTSIFTTPGSNYVYVGSSTGQLARLNADTGTQLWRVQPKGSNAIKKVITSVSGGIFVIVGSTLLSIDINDGAILWEMDAHTSTINGLASTYDDEIITVDNAGMIRKTQTDGTVGLVENAHSSALVSVDVDLTGNIHVLGSDGAIKRLNNDFSLSETYNLSGTTFHQLMMDHMGRYFVKVDSKVICINQVGQAIWQAEEVTGSALFVTRQPIMIPPVITEYSFVELIAPTNLQAF